VVCGLPRLGTGAAEIRYTKRNDVFLAMFSPGTQVAGVLTRSKTASAAVQWCRANLSLGTARALLANSGNANAFTGRAGAEAARAIALSVAGAAACRAQEVFIASTGVIGEPLASDKIVRVLGAIAETSATTGWKSAAEAIMTTDTVPKSAVATAPVVDRVCTVGGMVKGAGMIHPDMATLLGFLTTDAAVPTPELRGVLTPSLRREELLGMAGGAGLTIAELQRANERTRRSDEEISRGIARGESARAINNAEPGVLALRDIDFDCLPHPGVIDIQAVKPRLDHLRRGFAKQQRRKWLVIELHDHLPVLNILRRGSRDRDPGLHAPSV